VCIPIPTSNLREVPRELVTLVRPSASRRGNSGPPPHSWAFASARRPAPLDSRARSAARKGPLPAAATRATWRHRFCRGARDRPPQTRSRPRPRSCLTPTFVLAPHTSPMAVWLAPATVTTTAFSTSTLGARIKVEAASMASPRRQRRRRRRRRPQSPQSPRVEARALLAVSVRCRP
jgi:hypothetical protein